jgi:hypothetical protein
MGKVTTTLVITNRLDEGKAEDGLIPIEQVRSVTLENVLVDTGATTLCLPKDVIARLQLALVRQEFFGMPRFLCVGAKGLLSVWNCQKGKLRF